MKVFEILRNDIKAVSEQQLVNRIKEFDWKYEFSDNFSYMASKAKELELIENMVYQLWKNNPETAIKLWNENSPEAPADKSIVPSFIIRLQEQDK